MTGTYSALVSVSPSRKLPRAKEWRKGSQGLAWLGSLSLEECVDGRNHERYAAVVVMHRGYLPEGMIGGCIVCGAVVKAPSTHYPGFGLTGKVVKVVVSSQQHGIKNIGGAHAFLLRLLATERFLQATWT